jgi:hypothetical protein
MYIYRKFLVVYMLCSNNMPRTARSLQLVGCRSAAFCQQHPPAAKSRDKLRLEKNVNSAVSMVLTSYLFTRVCCALCGGYIKPCGLRWAVHPALGCQPVRRQLVGLSGHMLYGASRQLEVCGSGEWTCASRHTGTAHNHCELAL